MGKTKTVDPDECIKQECLIRDVPVDRLILNRENITLIWFQPKPSDKNIPKLLFLQQLRQLNDYILLYTEKPLYLNYLMCKQKKDDHIIVVLHNTEVLDVTLNCQQVRTIIIIGNDEDDIKQTTLPAKKYVKNILMFKNHDTLLHSELKKAVTNLEREILQNIGNMFRTFNKKERTLRDLRYDIVPFIWCHVFKVLIKSMPHTCKARDEMLQECRSYYSNNSSQLNMIDKFEQEYNSYNSIEWYTRSSFLFRLLNKALRTEKVDALYTFRYFIVDLCRSIEINSNNQHSLRVYHGGQMNRTEVENYTVGALVAVNGFLSTTRDIRVAYHFAGIDLNTERLPSQSREDEIQCVLFQIDIGSNRNECSDVIWADIVDQSMFPEEKEVLFDLGSIFEIIEIKYDCEGCYWHIKMCPSKDIIPQKREYEHYINQQMKETNPTVLFGILLTDMGEFEQSMRYFERLLKQMPDNHEDLSNVYYSLARIYRFIDQQEKALDYFRHAEQIQRIQLPDSSFDLARTLAGIASVYYELKDFEQELLYYQESLIIYQRIVSENHIDMARTDDLLGFAYANQQKYSEALIYLSKAVAIFDKLVPDGHPDLAKAFHNTGIVHGVLGHVDESLTYYQKSLKMRESTLPSDHPNIGQSCYQLSVFYMEQHQHDFALQYAQRAFSIYEKKFSIEHKLTKQVYDIIHLFSK